MDSRARAGIIQPDQLVKWVIIFANVGIDRYFSANFKYTDGQDSTHRTDLPELPFPGVALANITRPQWKKAIIEMRDIWSLSSRGLIILAPLSVALLQINSVATSRWGQILAVAAFMIALAGLLSSVLFILRGRSLLQDTVKFRWLEASRRPEEVRSVQFWSRLALPAVCATWSLIFATATILYIPFASVTPTSDNGNAKKFEMIAYALGVAFISALNGYFFFQVYRLKQLTA